MFSSQKLIAKRRHVFESAARLGDQRIGSAIIRIGALDEFVPLRDAHDDVTSMGAKRHPNETCRLRKEHVIEFLM